MGNIGIWQLLIVVVIVVLLFGTKKLRNLGTDLGSAVKGFKKAVTDEKSAEESKSSDTISDNSVAEKTVEDKQKEKDQA